MAESSAEPVNFESAESRRRHYLRRHRAMVTERDSFIAHWKDLTNYVQPRRGRYLTTKPNDGSKRNQNILDNTATKALRTLASGMMSGITSPARPWFKLATPDPEMMELAPVREWLNNVEFRMREVFNRSNVYNALHTTYEELGLFGTHCTLLTEHPKNVIHAYPFTAGEYCLALSEFNMVDAMTREWPVTVWQVVQRFGLNKVSERVRRLYRGGKYDEWVTVLHVVQPNVRERNGSERSERLPILSAYLELTEPGSGDPMFLRESGFREDPLIAPRWDVIGSDVYGRSPGMEALGDTKQLQLEQKRKAQGIDKLVDPPVTGPSSLAGQPVSTLPGGVTLSDAAAAGGGFRATYQVDPKLGDLRLDIQDTQLRIKEAFYEDLFRMTSVLDTRSDVTAREIAERHEEKLLQLGPVLERLHGELLDPLIDRTFAVMARKGLLPEAPPEMAGIPLRVEYISVLAQAQRAVGNSTIDRLFGFVGALAQLEPTVVDKVDFDQGVEEYAAALGAPPKIVRSDDEVEERRRARVELEAQQAQQAQQAVAADTASTLAEAERAQAEAGGVL